MVFHSPCETKSRIGPVPFVCSGNGGLYNVLISLGSAGKLVSFPVGTAGFLEMGGIHVSCRVRPKIIVIRENTSLRG